MKAITLTEPWATLMLLEEKKIETRSWPIPKHIIGQKVIIHSAKGFPRLAKELCVMEPFRTALTPGGQYAYPDLNRGKGLCVVRFVACVHTDDIHDKISRQEFEFGDYNEGRYAWISEYVERWTSFTPHVGHLGFWEW